MAAKDDLPARIAELEDEIKQRDLRIAELKQEIDEQRDLIERWRENTDDAASVLEAWRDTFDMVLTDEGGWTWAPFWEEHNALVDRFNALARKWNEIIREYNEHMFGKQPVGRPLNASEAQVAIVRKLHKQGMSLRAIVDETKVGLRTVRTIVGQIEGTDRTTARRRQRAGLEPIKIDKVDRARWKRQKRTGDALPKRAQAVAEANRELVQEGRGSDDPARRLIAATTGRSLVSFFEVPGSDTGQPKRASVSPSLRMTLAAGRGCAKVNFATSGLIHNGGVHAGAPNSATAQHFGRKEALGGSFCKFTLRYQPDG
jgi:hypothetical protein